MVVSMPVPGASDLSHCHTLHVPHEQVGSPNLEAFLQKHAKLLKADYALSADGGQLRWAARIAHRSLSNFWGGLQSPPA